MSKKRLIILIIQIIVFSIVLILFTVETGDKNLKVRLTIGGIFFALGSILIVFKNPIAKFMYEKQIKTIKQRSSIEKFAEGINHGGILLFSVGIVVTSVGLIFQ